MGVKFSKDKHISKWVDQENLIYEIESKTIQKDEEGRLFKWVAESFRIKGR